jgi:hypothetical protein
MTTYDYDSDDRDRMMPYGPLPSRTTRSPSREGHHDRSRRVRDRIRTERPLSGSRERRQSRSALPTRQHSYYDDLVDDIHYNVQNPIRDQREGRYFPASIPGYAGAPVDDYGNPLTLDIDIKSEKAPNWTNKRIETPRVLPESVSLEAAKAFTDETDNEKIILSPNSNSDPNIARNRRWM